MVSLFFNKDVYITKNYSFAQEKKKHGFASGLSQSRACPPNVRHLPEMFSDLLADEIVHLAAILAR